MPWPMASCKQNTGYAGTEYNRHFSGRRLNGIKQGQRIIYRSGGNLSSIWHPYNRNNPAVPPRFQNDCSRRPLRSATTEAYANPAGIISSAIIPSLVTIMILFTELAKPAFTFTNSLEAAKHFSFMLCTMGNLVLAGMPSKSAATG